ncbi:NAD(P)-binding protein [Mollisia scopiformis]|uniref:NAD(P)-binding protein n=1 Tax=Mollisia scopiformis TaxID=149040 RepID=A0A194WXF8_MOLSC|nr:NAD(P)-binding protein [Mollisia scopiformis]KUJ12369.1 NAD(P)-binding protein [Mollisia scopiformis]
MSTTTPLVWFITGCSSGIGLHLALHALRHGHHVIATSRSPSPSSPPPSELITSLGGHHLTLDVCSPLPILAEKVNEAMSIYGRIDVLVNNAGYALLGAFECISDEEARAQMETNFFGPLSLCRLLVPHFRHRRTGTILQISSAAGLEARASRSLYSASKFALEGFSEALSNEMQPFNVRVLLIEPGAFNSEFADKCVTPAKGWEEVRDEYRGSEMERVMGLVEGMRGGNMRNDVGKGVQAIWDTVMGTGVAEGMEAFLRVPLGRDAAERWEVVGELRRRTLEGTRRVWESCERDS